MSEGIQTPEGKPVDLDIEAAAETEKAFARAMTEPAGDEKAPPKRGPGRPPKTSDDGEKPRVRRGPGRPPKAATEAAKPKPAGLSHEVRKQGVMGMVQLSAAGCMLAERATGQKAFRADAITLASSADELGEALAATADQDERFARVIDKICAVGPYSALVGVVFSVGSQIARNHGAQLPGTHAPEDLIAMAEGQETHAQPAAA
jgi:hypothetical protein